MEASGLIIENVKEKSHIVVCTLCVSVYYTPLCKLFIEPPSDGLQSCVPKEDVLSGEILFCILPASGTGVCLCYLGVQLETCCCSNLGKLNTKYQLCFCFTTNVFGKHAFPGTFADFYTHHCVCHESCWEGMVYVLLHKP